MKKILQILVFATIYSICNAQINAERSIAEAWTRKADYGGGNRSYAVSFVIKGKAYVGTGLDVNGSVKDFWEYDPATDIWTRKADFAGAARDAASAFAINGKGYICMGKSGDYPFTYYKDLWEYDPVSDKWTKKADFPGIERAYGAGFSLGNKGYYACGYRYDYGAYRDFWEYDPVIDKWCRKANYAGGPTSNPYGFCIGDKAYMGLGWNGAWKNDFYAYDPLTNVWIRKADFGGSAREYVAGFSINSKGYIGVGYNGTGSKDFWEYDPATNTWTRKQDFGGSSRSGSVGFAINNKGYMGTGNLGSALYSDVWEYTGCIVACAGPTGLKVTNVSDTSAVLRWTVPADNIASYQLRYRAVGYSKFIKLTVKGTTNHILVCRLQPGTTYEWEMRSNCSVDTSVWVCGPKFTTTQLIASLSNIYITPNPNNGAFTLNMQLTDKNYATIIRVYNNTGRLIWQMNAGNISGNVNKTIILPTDIVSGIYTLTIERDDLHYKQQLIISK